MPELNLEDQKSPSLTQDLKEAIKTAYRGGKSLGSAEKEAEQLLNTMINAALSFGTSDIHLQNEGENDILVRFRVDGTLKPVLVLPPNIGEGIISRVKYITHMRLNVTVPQDGRFEAPHKDQNVVIRASLIPTRLGDDVTLRLLADVDRPKTLDELGFSEKDLEKIKRALARPYGMILACGPTGSGKTTTLYNMIGEVNTPDVNICTIEDPVEYVVQGVRQIQVDQKTGLDFATGLRAVLRHDPDIVFVGEVRDKETAEIAVDAALTGHLIFSSIHANTAAEVIPRLRDLGTRTYLIAATANLIVAQRLVKKLCQKCKTKTKPDKRDASLIKNEYAIDVSNLTVYEGKGCEECGGSGHHGRIGIFEVLKVSDQIKELILASAPLSQVTEQAKKEGFVTMFEDGLEKVKKGLLSLPSLLESTG